MSRTRVISQSKAVYVSPINLETGYWDHTGTTNLFVPAQLHRIDDFSFDVDIAGAREDVREFGQLARIAAVRMSELTPSVSLGYYLGNGQNEHNLGFNIKGVSGSGLTPVSQFISGILSEDVDKREKNIYVVTVEEGVDAFESSRFNSPAGRSKHDVVCFGNANPSSYTVNFEVGSMPRADVEFECGNITFVTGTSSGVFNPAVNRETAQTLDTGKFVLPAPSTGSNFTQVDVLKAGDITVSFSKDSTNLGGVNLNDIHVQSASIEVPLARTAIERLGSELPYARPLDFPIDVTVNVSALVDSFTSGSLQNVLTGCVNEDVDITITAKDRCNGQDRMIWVVKKAILDSQGFSMSLDDNETVDLTFSAQIGGANTTDAGVFCSGSFNGIGDPAVDNEVPKFL